MAKKILNRISQRAYAEMLGVSNTHVSNAVKDKLIKKGWDAQAKLIIVEHADVEWGDVVRKTPRTVDIQELHTPQTTPTENKKNEKLTISANARWDEAKRVGEIARAQLLLYELKEKAGQLVDKAIVQKSLIEYGTLIKKSFEQIPERNIDLIRAASSRNEALGILEEAIRNVLIELTTITETGLNKK